MIQGKSIAERQNDREALLLLKASYRCLRNERVIKYIMIFLSFAICIVAIFNRYLDYIFSSIANISELRDKIAIYINLISGGIIVAGIPLGFYTGRMHSEGTTLMDRYEAYVFDNEANSSILKPVSQTYITMYAKEIKKANSKFKNHIYPDGKVGNEHEAQYEFIKNQAYFDYGLYLYIQPFFYTIWIGFCILIMIMAVSFNDKFIPTLVNILIPSLSAITTIGVSWHSLHLQMKQLTNLINCIDRIEGMSATQKKLYISDKKKYKIACRRIV